MFRQAARLDLAERCQLAKLDTLYAAAAAAASAPPGEADPTFRLHVARYFRATQGTEAEDGAAAAGQGPAAMQGRRTTVRTTVVAQEDDVLSGEEVCAVLASPRPQHPLEGLDGPLAANLRTDIQDLIRSPVARGGGRGGGGGRGFGRKAPTPKGSNGNVRVIWDNDGEEDVNEGKGKHMTPRAIARIMHGLQSPAFPADQWRKTPGWGRYTKVDFLAVVRAPAAEEGGGR